MKSILIVDDDISSLNLIAAGLSLHPHYEIRKATSGIQAIELCRQSPPDLVILDIEMPGLSGIDVGSILNGSLDIPFLFLSSHDEDEIIHRAVASGSLGYLVKPVKANQLVPSIEIALKRAEDLATIKSNQLQAAGRDALLKKNRAELETILNLQVATQTASAIAHDINQPLAAISAYGEVALRELGSSNTDYEKLAIALKGCVDQSHRAGACVHEWLGLLQVSEHMTSAVCIDDIMRDSLAMIGNEGISGINIHLDLEANAAPVRVHPVQALKVMLNLLRNSAEAISQTKSEGGTITIKTMARMGMLQITVEDNGPGLLAEASQRAFEPFFTTKPDQIGLGLAISQSLIEVNGGRLWLDTDTRVGATFHFTLPVAS